MLFIGSVLLVLTRRVQVKQLPYDNKDEILLVLDMPAGTTLERTDAAAREFERYLESVPEITDFEAYVGTASPVDFNGLMRQYFLRRSPNRADIRINLIHKTERDCVEPRPGIAPARRPDGHRRTRRREAEDRRTAGRTAGHVHRGRGRLRRARRSRTRT